VKGSAEPGPLLPDSSHADLNVAVILIQEGVVLKQVHADHVYVLSEDASTRGITPAFPTVSYRDMIQMMFEADSVVAL
jgi:sulfur transfer complex TusBCD TusB component (DsrH family)